MFSLFSSVWIKTVALECAESSSVSSPVLLDVSEGSQIQQRRIQGVVLPFTNVGLFCFFLVKQNKTNLSEKKRNQRHEAAAAAMTAAALVGVYLLQLLSPGR